MDYYDTTLFYLCLVFICLIHKLTVFYINIATVNGPTPPGTGVPNNAYFLAFSQMSPLNLPFASLLIPMSIAIPPGLSLVIRLGFPTADMTISASDVSLLRSYVWEWHKVIVAFLFRRRWNRGRPTSELRPTIITSFPETLMLCSSRILRTPEGVQGINWGFPSSITFALLTIVKQSTSLRGFILLVSYLLYSDMLAIRGSWRRTPDTSGFWFKFWISVES